MTSPKDANKAPEMDLKEMDIYEPPEKELRIIVLRSSVNAHYMECLIQAWRII